MTAIANKLSALRFGELTVIVHDGKAVQLEVKEKVRFVR